VTVRRAPAGALALACLLTWAAPAAAGVRTAPTIPPVEGAVAEQVREIAARGEALGNHPDVFAKVGDSITESNAFLSELACEEPAWGGWGGLAATREQFGFRAFPVSYTSVWCGRANSFSRASVTAVQGWDALDALVPMGREAPPGCAESSSALACEYGLIQPSIALVMYGTNDVESFDPQAYETNLELLVESSIEAGVIPVLSTIPPRLDSRPGNRRVLQFNRRVIAVADRASIPLWNYWRALRGPRMVHRGIGPDGVHPNLYGGCVEPLGCRAFDFTREGLRYGFNQRNLGALRVLERLRAAIG
jgi:hypothetical protein